MLITKIRVVLSTALILSFLVVATSTVMMESSHEWRDIHETSGWIFIALVALHLIINAKIYFAEMHSFFRKK